MLQHTEVEARSRALVASIVAVADQPDHVRALGAMLLELLEPVWDRDRDRDRDGGIAPRETSMVPENHPKNTVRSMDPLTASKRPATPAERQRKRRQLLKVAAVDAQLALEGVTPVTRCHADAVTNVTASVTRDVTSSSDLLSSPRPSRGLGEEREKALESFSVTRDAVTVVTLPPVLEAGLRAIFKRELEHRPGVELDADGLWRKFLRKKSPTMALVELRNTWRHWCRTEWPDDETRVRQLPLTPPPREVEKEEAAAAGPGIRSAPVDPEERSRRDEAAAWERRARERAEVEQEKQVSGIRELVATKLGDMFTPEAMEAARAAVFKTARKSA